MNGYCPSYILGIEKHLMELEPIPTERIIVFAEEFQPTSITADLLEDLFYDDYKQSSRPFYASVSQSLESEEEKTVTSDSAYAKIQEEHWKSFGFVMTKRKRGKFITWEKIE
jgi:hypothetical protein